MESINTLWQWVRLGDYLEKMTTAKLDKETFSYIDIESIDNKTQTVTNPKIFPSSKAPSRARREVKEGDTLFSMVRPYLKNIAFIDSSLSHCVASTGFYVCRPKISISPKYLFHIMTSPFVINGLNYFMRGDNSPSIRSYDLENFQIPLPPLEIQKQIVEILESHLEKIAQIQTRLETILKQCQTYRLSLLADAFNGNLTPHSQDWQWVRLGEIVEIIGGGTPNTAISEYWDGEIPWLSIADFNQEKKFVSQTQKTITQKGLKESSTKMLNSGDIIISARGTIGAVAILSCPMAFNQSCYGIKTSEKISGDFLYWILKQFSQTLKNNSYGVCLKAITKRNLDELQIPLPPLEIQKEIVEILESKLEKIERAQALIRSTLKACETYRLSLLKSAFLGKLV